MNIARELRKSAGLALWFAVLTFPLMIIRVNTITNTIEWRWERLILIGVGGFLGSFIWNFFLSRQKTRGAARKATKADAGDESGSEQPDETGTLLDRILERFGWSRDTFRQRKVALPLGGVLLVLVIAYPFATSLYQTNIMISALIYVILALGLNIVIGLGGLLQLGYAAFYAVGAYTYALLNFHFGVNFWIALPLGATASMIFGILLAIPVLRLRGDYLAIVTLAFGEITRIVLTNWDGLSFGPSGIKGIPRPGLFGIDLTLDGTLNLTYFVCIVLVVVTVFVVNRLENSRIGRQWVAMGEDDVAARAMGVNTTKAKLTAFAIGAFWAGLAGVIFAARTTFVNPESFRVWESVLILCMVVLGGMGSIPGVIIGALILILLPEYLRAFSDYRLLIFGGVLVVMMVFRPGGLIPKRRKAYQLRREEMGEHHERA
ncbi:MAG: branched-chain amino acid ABC transporter permease [Spirochaetia bacterium]